MSEVVVEAFIKDDLCVKVWKGRLGDSIGPYWCGFRDFWVEVLSKEFASPSDAIEFQVNVVGRERYHILDLAQQWVEQHPKWRFNTKTSKISHIRSFFLHNRASLPVDRSFHFSRSIPPVEGNLTFEAFTRILHNSNKLYRAVFLMMAQGLMGERELVYVNCNLWREVLEALTKNVGEFKLVIPGRKRNRNRKNFHTVLSTKGDWAEAYRDYVKSVSHKILGALYINDFGNPVKEYNIQFYFHCRAVESGVITQITPSCSKCHGETLRLRKTHPSGSRKIAFKCRECGNWDWACDLKLDLRSNRYGVNPHEIRDLMRSRWQVSGADPTVAELFLGHEIDPNNYNKFTKYEPWYPIQEYRKALPWLNILSMDPRKVDRIEIDAKIEARDVEMDILRREVARLRRDQEDIQAVKDNLPLMLEFIKERKKIELAKEQKKREMHK